MFCYDGPHLFRQLVKDEEIDRVRAPIVIGAAPTTLFTTKTFNVVEGDRIRCSWDHEITKGGVGGSTLVGITKDSGTAVLYRKGTDLVTRMVILSVPYHLQNTDWYGLMDELFTVFASGTYALEILGMSAGSNGQLNADDANIQTIVFR